MKHSEAAFLLARLKAAFLNTEMDEKSFEEYCNELIALDYDIAKEAVKVLVMTCKFFPRVSEIVAEVEAIKFGTVEQQWGALVEQVRGVGFYRQPKFSNPLIDQAVSLIGWDKLCHSTNPEALKAEFVKAFEALQRDEYRQRAVAAIAAGRQQKQLGEGGAE